MPLSQINGQKISRELRANVKQQFRESRNTFLTPMSDIDLMIANGWGNTPRVDIPKDWRTRIKEAV